MQRKRTWTRSAGGPVGLNLHAWLARLAGLASCALIGGCAVPGHMHVTQGVSPQNLDTNVRFRTTYYFRVFDACRGADLAVGSGKYDRIVPETDTLYRYRMTGKASALGNRIKFESGTLKSSRIDPFGADVTYNEDINGFLFRSEDEAKAEAKEIATERQRDAAVQRSAEQAQAAFERYDQLKRLLAGLADDAAEKPAIQEQMRRALQQYVAILSPPPEPEAKAAVAPPAAAAAAAEAAAKLCPDGMPAQRGFQIMGPEGMRAFNQDERLLMAMHSSAAPLIETLNEYSGRLLKPRANAATQMLPISREMTAAVRGQRMVSDQVIAHRGADTAVSTRITSMFDEVIRSFNEEGR